MLPFLFFAGKPKDQKRGQDFLPLGSWCIQKQWGFLSLGAQSNVLEKMVQVTWSLFKPDDRTMRTTRQCSFSVCIRTSVCSCGVGVLVLWWKRKFFVVCVCGSCCCYPWLTSMAALQNLKPKHSIPFCWLNCDRSRGWGRAVRASATRTCANHI